MEKQYLEHIKDILIEANRNVEHVKGRTGATYFDIEYQLYSFCRFKLTGKLNYWLVDIPIDVFKENYITDIEFTPATSSEGIEKTRVLIKNPSDLLEFKNIIINQYDRSVEAFKWYENYLEERRMRNRSKPSHRKFDSTYDFIAIDFETANNNLASACSLGLAFVKDNTIIDTKYTLIQPPSLNFNPTNVSIHGITEDIVKDAPLFPEVWNEINEHFQGNYMIVSHNAQFDMNVLMNCLNYFELEIPDFAHVCSIPITTRACTERGIGSSLAERAVHFGITLDEHHNALSDAITCAQLVIESVKRKGKKNLSAYCSTYHSIPINEFKELKIQTSLQTGGRRFENVPIREITATTDAFDEQHVFFGKAIVLTGDLESMDRKTAMQTIVDLGGINRSGVSRKTDFLIVGKQDLKLVGEGGISNKEKKAYELVEKGHSIKIINEDEFLKYI